MVELILETDNLIFHLNNFTFAINKLGLLVLQVESLGVDELVEIVNSGQLFADIVLQGSSLSGQIAAFLGFELVLVVQLVNFFSILAVALSQILKFVFKMFFLLQELVV